MNTVWTERPTEVANLLNPAFTGAALRLAVAGYFGEAKAGMPFELAFLCASLRIARGHSKSVATGRIHPSAYVAARKSRCRRSVSRTDTIAGSIHKRGDCFQLPTGCLGLGRRRGDSSWGSEAEESGILQDNQQRDKGSVEPSRVRGQVVRSVWQPRDNSHPAGSASMSLQLLALAIYNSAGERREVRFDPGKVNIITGASKTGKTAIIDIVDYCLGRNEFIIPSGVIRDKVTWYALQVQLPNSQAVIGRPAPTGGAATTTDVFLDVGGDLAFPSFDDLRRTTNSDALAGFLTEAVGIRANENVPSEGQSRSPLQANIKHTRFLLFQPQYRIADRNMMFFRQEEPFVPQSIKDTLPYFLGARSTN